MVAPVIYPDNEILALIMPRLAILPGYYYPLGSRAIPTITQ